MGKNFISEFTNKTARVLNRHKFKFSALLAASILVLLFQNCAREMNMAEYSSDVGTGLDGSLTADITEILNNQTAITQILSDSTNKSVFTCLLSDTTPCLVGSLRSALLNRIYDPNSLVYLDDLKNTHRGLTEDGNACSTFNFLNNIEGIADANCPLRVEVKWEPICASGGYNCPNSQLMHKFRVVQTRSKVGEPNKIISDKVVQPNSSMYRFKTFSDQKGNGYEFFNLNVTTNQKTPVYHYLSCMGAMTYSSATAQCSCASGYTEDLDITQKCMIASRACQTVSIANSASCTEVYSTSSNTYVLSSFTCATNYTKSGNSCVLANGTWVALAIGTSAYTSATCAATYTVGQTGAPVAGQTCSPIGTVHCVTSLLAIKYKCQ